MRLDGNALSDEPDRSPALLQGSWSQCASKIGGQGCLRSVQPRTASGPWLDFWVSPMLSLGVAAHLEPLKWQFNVQPRGVDPRLPAARRPVSLSGGRAAKTRLGSHPAGSGEDRSGLTEAPFAWAYTSYIRKQPVVSFKKSHLACTFLLFCWCVSFLERFGKLVRTMGCSGDYEP